VCKSADLLLMVLDANKPLYHKEILTRELESVGIRLNRSAPNIYFKKRKTGGMSINSTVPLTKMDDKLIHRVLQVGLGGKGGRGGDQGRLTGGPGRESSLGAGGLGCSGASRPWRRLTPWLRTP
jgi:hypothetical protein